MGLFGSAKTPGSGTAEVFARSSRHSSGWKALSAHLRAEESLRVLDFGPTSAGNINFVTSLGHSIYMANLVEDAARPEYRTTDAEGEPAYDVERFMAQNLNFSGRSFSVVTLWDTLDYLPDALLQPVVDRLFEVMVPGGQLLAFFHSKTSGEDAAFSRYHLTDRAEVEMQRGGAFPILHALTNRQIEGLFSRYSSYKFFLAKDALREVLVRR